MSNPEELAKIRRLKQAKDDAWITAFLQRGAFGTLATSVDDQPFLVTRNYAYDANKHAIYLHGAHKGRTIENIQRNPKVCFSVSEMGRLIPQETACEFGVEYAGVVVFGEAHLVQDAEEARHALQMLLEKYFPQYQSGRDYAQMSERDIKRTAVLRIEVHAWSGKETREEKDFPAAFSYPCQPEHPEGEA